MHPRKEGAFTLKGLILHFVLKDSARGKDSPRRENKTKERG